MDFLNNTPRPQMGDADSLAIAQEMIKILYAKGAMDIRLYAAAEEISLTDYHIIATGRVSTHVKSLADDLEFEMEERGVLARSMEGRDAGAWILLDYYRVMVHIFDTESRNYYHLERLQKPENSMDISGLLPQDEA